MTSWLENKKKCILSKENTRRRCFRLRKNNEADKTSDPIQSNPWMNPMHVQLWYICMSWLSICNTVYRLWVWYWFSTHDVWYW